MHSWSRPTNWSITRASTASSAVISDSHAWCLRGIHHCGSGMSCTSWSCGANPVSTQSSSLVSTHTNAYTLLQQWKFRHAKICVLHYNLNPVYWFTFSMQKQGNIHKRIMSWIRIRSSYLCKYLTYWYLPTLTLFPIYYMECGHTSLSTHSGWPLNDW